MKKKVTILGAVFCEDKTKETCENLQKANKSLQKLKEGYGKFTSLVGKILRINTYICSTIWNNAWLINTSDEHFRLFIKELAKYIQKIKGGEILEKVMRRKEEGGLNLLNIKERIEAIKVAEIIKADKQIPETDNIIFETGTKQNLIYNTSFKGPRSENTNDIILTIEKNITSINSFKKNHKQIKPKDIQNILFPKEKITYFKEILDSGEPKLISTNYIMLYDLLPIFGNRRCNLCKKEEESLNHVLFRCSFLPRTRELVRKWLREMPMGDDTFDRRRIVEMMGVKKGLENYIISLYKDTVWTYRNIAWSKSITGEQAIINTMESNAQFYIRFIHKG